MEVQDSGCWFQESAFGVGGSRLHGLPAQSRDWARFRELLVAVAGDFFRTTNKRFRSRFLHGF